MDERRSLNTFAQTHVRKPGIQPWLTTIPEYPEILEGWKSGVSLVQIHLWLIEECGYDPTIATRNRVMHLCRVHPRRIHG